MISRSLKCDRDPCVPILVDPNRSCSEPRQIWIDKETHTDLENKRKRKGKTELELERKRRIERREEVEERKRRRRRRGRRRRREESYPDSMCPITPNVNFKKTV